MGKGVSPGDIVDKESPDGTSIVRSGNGSEILLAGRVPDLQFDALISNGDGFSSELDSDGDVVGCSSFVLDELQHDAWFAYAGVSDDDEFKQVVVIVHTYYIITLHYFLPVLPLYYTSLFI